MKKPNKKQIDEFLRESSAIEGEYSEEAFQDAVKAWNYLIKRKVLTMDVILKTHELLMRSRTTIPEEEKGKFRQCKVWIGGREGSDWKDVPTKIFWWCFEMMGLTTNTDKDFLENKSKNLHVAYEKIHGFSDGNGRTGRMFMNWWRLRIGLPVLIIHEGKEQRDYYRWFK